MSGAAFTLAARDAKFQRIQSNVILVEDTTKALGDLARWHRSRFKVPVVGVTGSCGKTTVKDMIRLVLGRDVVASPGSFNNEVGVPLTLLQMDAQTRACVVEIGANAPGQIAALTAIARPTIGVVTNVEEVHLEGLGSVRGVMEEKSALLKGLPHDGFAIVNADSYWCREMMESVACRLVTYGTWEDSDVHGLEPRFTPNGIAFDLYGRLCIEVPALGFHNVSNALAAIAVGLLLGLDPLTVRDALADFHAHPMRMASESVAGVTLINDAYNANPRAMDAALHELSARPGQGRRIAVFGEMLELGERSEQLHRELGRKVANARIEYLWAIGPSAAMVAAEAVQFGMPSTHIFQHVHIEEALEHPPLHPQAGDVWLFKASRGMRLERLVERTRGLAVHVIQATRAADQSARLAAVEEWRMWAHAHPEGKRAIDDWLNADASLSPLENAIAARSVPPPASAPTVGLVAYLLVLREACEADVMAGGVAPERLLTLLLAVRARLA